MVRKGPNALLSEPGFVGFWDCRIFAVMMSPSKHVRKGLARVALRRAQGDTRRFLITVLLGAMQC